jgi:hypothetical protein
MEAHQLSDPSIWRVGGTNCYPERVVLVQPVSVFRAAELKVNDIPRMKVEGPYRWLRLKRGLHVDFLFATAFVCTEAKHCAGLWRGVLGRLAGRAANWE